MATKKVKLGYYLDILQLIYNKSPSSILDIVHGVYTLNDINRILNDLEMYGLIKYDKDNSTYILTNKGIKFLEKVEKDPEEIYEV